MLPNELRKIHPQFNNQRLICLHTQNMRTDKKKRIDEIVCGKLPLTYVALRVPVHV